ncbi:MAG: hypothetical protein OXE57_14970 [Alphaproteobacteria bacterium]|nr:hypothetical protein [Alphaproteobacteria bacterium]
MTDTDIADGNRPPVPLPSIETLRQLLPWSQAAPRALPGGPPETREDLARLAPDILRFLWAGYPGSPFHSFNDEADRGGPVIPSDFFRAGDPHDHFEAHARKVGPEAAAAAVILADVAESLDVVGTLPGPTLLDETLSAIARGDCDLRARAEELLAAIRSEAEPAVAAPGLPDPNVLATLLRHIHPPGPDRQAPLWPQVIHQARRIALFDRLVPREDWRQARMQLGRHRAAAAAIVAAAKQSLELVSDPAGSLRGTVAAALKKPATLDRTARKLVQATARLSLLPDSGTLDVRTPSLKRARELYTRLCPHSPTGPDTDKCSWHNLYDRIVRIDLPDQHRFGNKPDLSEAKELLGQRAFTVVAILTLFRDIRRFRHSGLGELCFESAIRAASAGPLDLDELVAAGDESDPVPVNAAFAAPLKPIPDIHDIRNLIPETQWAPVSAEPGQRNGWASVIDNARRLGREALDIDDETWARLEDKIEPRGAAAAVLYATPRPALAPEPRLIDRIARLRSRYDRNWFSGIHARALSAIEAEIDLAVVAALENGEFQPAAPELLPGPDVMKRHGPRSIRERIDDGSELDWDELTATGRGLATGRLHLSEDDWRRACRILGPHRAAAAALTAAAFEEERSRKNFAKIVFHEATRPGSLPELLRRNWLLYRSRTSFKVSDSVSVETGL